MVNLLADSTSLHTLAGLVTSHLSPSEVPVEQWEGLSELAVDHGLGEMLLWALRQAGWLSADELRWQTLIDATRRNGLRSLLLEKARFQAATALDRAGIPAIWLKGIALAQRCYPEPHLRPMDDLDLLVSANQLEDTREALLAAGFRPAGDDFFELSGLTRQVRHHEALLSPSGLVRLELHFRLIDPALHARVEPGVLDCFWSQSVDLAPDGPSFRIFKPEANLLHLCAHTILQPHGERLDLLHLLDLHLLIVHSRVDWEMLLEQAAALRWTYAVEQALRLLPGLFGTPLPEGLLGKLQQQRPGDELLPAAPDHLQGARRWADWLQAFGELPVTGRLRLVWRTLIPPSAYLRNYYRLPPGRWLWPYYVLHFLDGGGEVLRALRRKVLP